MTLCDFIALEKTKWIPFAQWIISEQGLMFVLFLLVIMDQTIMFVGTKRNKSILYPISSNTQWGVDTIVYQ